MLDAKAADYRLQSQHQSEQAAQSRLSALTTLICVMTTDLIGPGMQQQDNAIPLNALLSSSKEVIIGSALV